MLSSILAKAVPGKPAPTPAPRRRGAGSGLADRAALFDSARLAGDIARLAERQDLSQTELRNGVLARLRDALANGREEVERRFMAQKPGERIGEKTVRSLAFVMDELIRVLADFTTERVFPAGNPTLGEQIAVVAVGGYGRGELAPFSDVDLLFLLPYKQTPRGEQVVEYLLYMLWDLGLKVGHSTRSIDECLRQARGDVTIRTAMLESRPIWGSEALYDELEQRFEAEVVQGTALDFVEAKLTERSTRHDKMGGSRYVLEPNIKEGKGGLRDLHTLFWIAKYVYGADSIDQLVRDGVMTSAEKRSFVKSQDFLWTLRCHLHYLTGRAEERITFDVQTEMARRLGYTDHAGTIAVERFMKHYFVIAKEVGNLTRIVCAAIEAKIQRRPRLRLPAMPFRKRNYDGFVLDGERLSVPRPDIFATDPVNFIRLFHSAQAHDLDVHPDALLLIAQNLRRVDASLRADAEANRLFLEILSSPKGPERALRLMNEAGVLGRFVPDFGRVVAQMQFDMYHVYTTDEHTIRAMGILHQIEAGQLAEIAPVASEIVHKVLSRRALFVGLFLHDIAKGRGGNHSTLGEKVAMRLGPRFGLSDEETETVAWLVRNHLWFTAFAFKRDIGDPKTIQDFCEIIKSPERLRLLLVLTVADVRATNPAIWNNWKAALLRDLYYRADEVLSGEVSQAALASGQQNNARAEAAKSALRAALTDWEPPAIDAHLALGPTAYWLGFDADSHARHARLMREAALMEAPLLIDTRIDAHRGVTEVTICTPDHPGLFSRLAGAMAVGGASIVDARIFTMANGMALDVFWVQDATDGPFDQPTKLAKLSAAIHKAMSGELRPKQELLKRVASVPSRTRVFKVPPRVLIDNKASATHTVIELNGRDRPGLLYDVTRALTQLSLQISSAKISTYGEMAIDVFYVKDVFGLKVEHAQKLAGIRDSLLRALAEPGSAQSMEKRRKPTARAAE
ncbi:[protein-PII] uridylyltransferase [Oceanibaculum pacificum]|uniref:Bifunctional uridylyltransferase/uridylyl-removing enzyme n=1 Tax=Oceanibaculum pacificum TaxID=580166 RepID=A0A154WB53_9PROT|nr:[protein-PII] uridylyltransferase [Oceanibaculum pacificum]KZD10705.1 bifunctional uridylyltransferase/uridylyl-removing protein [Oceanibaculum pacificum]